MNKNKRNEQKTKSKEKQKEMNKNAMSKKNKKKWTDTDLFTKVGKKYNKKQEKPLYYGDFGSQVWGGQRWQ